MIYNDLAHSVVSMAVEIAPTKVEGKPAVLSR